MGMFDSVLLPCPHCGEEVELQSKSGECSLECYYPLRGDKVPLDVADDLSRSNSDFNTECHSCRGKFRLVYKQPVRVKCWLEKDEEEDS
jgi:hypothetical protein